MRHFMQLVDVFIQDDLRAHAIGVNVRLGIALTILPIVSFTSGCGSVWDRGRFVVGQI